MAFEPKQFGRFYLLEKLAVGGMAEIYKAKTYGAEGFEKLLAIKRILPHCSADKEFIRMLIDEAKLSVLLSHANIVQVYDLGKVGEDFFISMEYINGVNLRDILYRCRELNREIPPELAIFIISEVCKGLDYAHRKTDSDGKPLGIVHRDISPQNILISFEGEVKIVDFGIAKAAMNISHTMAGILKGKIAYMSPEQALGKPVDYRTDIFSAGIILHECLTGRKLFKGESQFEVLKKIRSTRIKEDTLPEVIPNALRPILAKALSYLTKERYQNCGDMQSDLTRHLYSSYVDFTPQRLANFVRELFAGELERQQQQAIARHQREQPTASVNIAEEALHEAIVQRDGQDATDPDITPTPLTASGTIPLPPERSVTGSIVPSRRSWSRLGSVIAIALLLGITGYAYYRWIHPQLFPAPIAIVELGTLRIDSQPGNAEILLDGKTMLQQTPALIEQLQLHKDYTLTLHKEGFVPATQQVRLTSATPVNITMKLVKQVKTAPSIPVQQEQIAQAKPKPKPQPPVVVPPTIEGPKVTLEATPEQTKSEPKPEIVAPIAGSVTVDTTPQGANIWLNGKDTGLTTPATVENLAFGKKHTIQVKKKGYTGWARSFRLSKDEPTLKLAQAVSAQNTAKPKPKPSTDSKAKDEIKPKPKPPVRETTVTQQGNASFEQTTETVVDYGSVTIHSKPKGASIYLDGKSFGRTPLTIDRVRTGTHNIRLERKGYQNHSQSISVTTGEERYLKISLEKKDKS